MLKQLKPCSNKLPQHADSESSECAGVAKPFCGSSNPSCEGFALPPQLFAVAGQDSLDVEVAIQFVGDALVSS